MKKTLAIVSSVIAVCQAATTWIEGYWKSENDRAKQEYELKMAILKTNTETIEKVPLMYDGKDQPNRTMWASAIMSINDHPLQPWARENIQKTNNASDKIAQVFDKMKEGVISGAITKENFNERKLEAQIEMQGAEVNIASSFESKKELTNDGINKMYELVLIRATKAKKSELPLNTVSDNAELIINHPDYFNKKQPIIID